MVKMQEEKANVSLLAPSQFFLMDDFVCNDPH